jgi:hypothetical protein
MNSPTSFPPAVALPPHPTLARELVPERRGAVAVFSHTRRDADWILPRLFRIFAFCGHAEIDLTRALVGPGTSEIEIRCIMGHVDVIVPPDLRVESEVDAVIGNAQLRRRVSSTTSPDAPAVRITGSAFMGAIDIRIIDPNEPGFMEKIRRRLKGKVRDDRR